MKDLEGLTAIVTGGASGIGAATATVLRERGANVAILDRTIATLDTDFFSIICDVTDTVAVEEAVAAVAVKTLLDGRKQGVLKLSDDDACAPGGIRYNNFGATVKGNDGSCSSNFEKLVKAHMMKS